jgi:DNA-binding LacI/PurR family transcriptional regulator
MAHVHPNDAAWVGEYLNTGRADGFILMTSTHKPYHIKTLLQAGAPFIVWGMPMPGLSYCSVMGDNYTGGSLAAQHLVSRGRQRIAFLGGPADELEVRLRYDGYAAALGKAGLSVGPELLAYADFTPESGAAAMHQLLAQAPDLDAVFVNSDVMALAAIDVLRQSGRQVPEDVAVVGYDDLSIASISQPALTTIRQNIPAAGRLLAENLIQYLKTGIVTTASIPVELVVRGST